MHLKSFPKLRSLEINRIQEVPTLRILQFACDEIGHQLRRLYCNLERLTHTAYQPDETGLAAFERLYVCLRSANVNPNLKIFFHGVQLDSRLEFADYRFDEKLINVYHQNHVINGLTLAHHRSIRCAKYLDVLDTFFGRGPQRIEQWGKRNFGLLRFSQLFSNVRIVVLENERGRRQLIESEPFLNFLKHQRALTELSIRCAGFPAGFYSRLVEVESLVTLDGFFLSEPLAYRSVERVNFAFLSHFRRLYRFSTNLAVASVMFELIAGMQESAAFRFRFWNPLEGFAFYHCQVRRLCAEKITKSAKVESEEETDSQPLYELAVQLKDTRDPRSQSELYRSILTAEELRDFFDQPANLKITSHWLDGVAEYSQTTLNGQTSPNDQTPLNGRI